MMAEEIIHITWKPRQFFWQQEVGGNSFVAKNITWNNFYTAVSFRVAEGDLFLYDSQLFSPVSALCLLASSCSCHRHKRFDRGGSVSALFHLFVSKKSILHSSGQIVLCFFFFRHSIIRLFRSRKITKFQIFVFANIGQKFKTIQFQPKINQFPANLHPICVNVKVKSLHELHLERSKVKVTTA